MIQITKETTVKDLVEMASKNTLVEVLESYEKFIRADERKKGEDEFDVAFTALFGLKQKVDKAFNEAIEEIKEIHEHFRKQKEEQGK